MKTNSIFAALTASILFLVSCTSGDLSTQAPSPEVVAFDASEFNEPDPETYVTIITPALQEYFYYRKQAVITGNIEEFWEHFPELRKDVDIVRGVNSEEIIVTGYQSLKPIDGDVFPGYYEHHKVKVINEQQIEVLVHGQESYTGLNEENELESSGSEFKLVLYLHQKDNRWVVYKTDEVKMNE